MDGVGDHQRLGDHAAVVAHLDVLGVQPQVGVGALQRTLTEQLDLLIQCPAHLRDAVLGHPLDPELLDETIHLPGRHAIDIRLEHHATIASSERRRGSRKLGK
jgi:hypothetical protein